MRTALITGGAGFFGSILKQRLLREGWKITSIDLQSDDTVHPQLTVVQGDIRDRALMRSICKDQNIEVVFHCAAILAHAVKDKDFLWSCNVDGAQSVVDTMMDSGIRTIVFTSSNCLWGEPMGHPIDEAEPPKPVEIYGQSKWEAEQILWKNNKELHVIILRCPTIVDAGRLGLLAILFEFIDEGRKVWVVGGGKNKYQFIYADDLATACIKSADYQGSALWNIGSDHVKSFREVYESVILQAKTGARVASLPRSPTIIAMKVAYALGFSPLGPYQYKMIAEDFEFNTEKIKRELGWSPTLTNEAMLLKAYDFYRENRKNLHATDSLSAHRQPAKMGVIRLLKWLS